MTLPSKLVSLFTGVCALTCFVPNAHAEDWSLHTQVGAELSATNPQLNNYDPGAVLNASLLFPVFTPNLAVGPSVSGTYMSRTDNSNAGAIVQFGGTVRLQGDRSADASPWLEGNLSYAHTGDLNRPAFGVRMGLDMFTDSVHEVSMGPWFGFDHIFQTSTTDGPSPLLNSNDYNAVQFGWSINFDGPVKPRVETKLVERVVVVHAHNHCATCQPTVLVAPAPETFTERVYFNWDSAVIRNWEEADKVDALVAKLNKFPKATVVVNGHASKDGNHQHNVVLAQHRTAAVVAYLVAHGVDASRITSQSFGPDMPSAPNATQEGRERNRRVQFDVSFVVSNATN